VAVGSLLLGGAPRRRLICALVSANLESARQEWEQAYRALAEVRDPALDDRIGIQLEVITAELRRRVGAHFTIRDLADEYALADVWARDVLSEQGTREWPRTLTLVEGAAFHLYARGAVDYEP
jgi:hypothetical protein